jgi:chromosome segregation ATPase
MAEAAAEEQRLLAQAAELRRRREVEEARRKAEAAEVRRRAEAEMARRKAAEDSRRQAEAEEAIRRAAIEEAERRAADAAARREAELALETRRQFLQLEARIEQLQRSCDDNQIEPVRHELLELLHQIQELDRGGRSVADAVEQAHARLDEMDVKLNAARNMAGNRLGDIQDRLTGLSERLNEIEVEIPGFDAVRENQGAILERFDRMESLVERLTAADELVEQVEGVRRQLLSSASQQEVARIGEQINSLVNRIDALPDALGNDPVLERMEGQLQALAGEFVEARRERKSVTIDLDERLSELSAMLRDIGETGRTPDLSGLDERLSEIGARLGEDRRASSDALGRLDRRLSDLTAAVEAQENEAATDILASLTRKLDSLSEAIDSQDARGTRRDIASLDRKFDQLADQLAEQAQHLSRPQIAPLEARLDIMQAQLEELARRAHDSTAQFGPFAQKLQEISDRVSALGTSGAPTPLSQRLAAIEERIAGFSGKGTDLRSLHTQLEGIVSRLELLKGRSIDPARLNDLFDRVDAAIHALPGDRSAAAIEQILASGARSGVPEERFARIEQKLDEIGRISQAAGESLTNEDLAELRSDIVALRRELRSLPNLGEGEGGFGEALRSLTERLAHISGERPASAAELEMQIERIAQMLDDPRHSRLALAHIETSLKTIEERLEETRRLHPGRASDDADVGDAVSTWSPVWLALCRMTSLT